MDDIWIISWFNHTACDANPIWKSPNVTKRVDGMTVHLNDKADLKFAFDAVFTPGSQEEVFEECRDLVRLRTDYLLGGN